MARADYDLCGECGAQVPVQESGECDPCPSCGSTSRVALVTLAATAHAQATVRATVDRAATDTRVAAFAVIFATALNVGLWVGYTSAWWCGVLAGIGTAIATVGLLALVYRVGPIRRFVMEFMHQITGQ
jgi:hypothetical protein